MCAFNDTQCSPKLYSQDRCERGPFSSEPSKQLLNIYFQFALGIIGGVYIWRPTFQKYFSDKAETLKAEAVSKQSK